MVQKARSGWRLRAHTQALPGEPPQSRDHRAPACAAWPPHSSVSTSILSSGQRASVPQSQGLTIPPLAVERPPGCAVSSVLPKASF